VSQPLGLRDRAILELLDSAGVRRIEAMNLAVHDLDQRCRSPTGGIDIAGAKDRNRRRQPVRADAHPVAHRIPLTGDSEPGG